MTFKTDDRVYETSTTTGTGTYTLDGAAVGFTTFAALIGANNDCAYFATDDTNWEVGIGTVLTGPARLQRTTILRSSNADAAVNWGAGTRKLRCGLPAAMAVPRALSKSVAGSSDVTLTQDEQRRRVLVLTGVLTGNINVIVDATVWDWVIYNNTTGSYTLKVKTSGGTGEFIAQGKRAKVYCDGTNVVSAQTDFRTMGLGSGFSAYKSASTNNVTGNGTAYTVICDTELFDYNSDYNAGSGVFTAAVTWAHRFHATVQLSGMTGATEARILLVTSNRTYTRILEGTPSGSGDKSVSLDVWADMDAGDTAYIRVQVTGIGADTADVYGTSAPHTWFSGGPVI